MKNLLPLFFLSLSVSAYGQTVNANWLVFNDPTLGLNGDNTVMYRSDPAPDYTRLRMQLGDEETAMFEMGYPYYSTGQWTNIFTVDGYGNGFFKGNLTSNGNIFSYRASSGYLALGSDLPGYPSGTYPTLQTNASYLYFSASGKYSGFLGDSQTRFGLNDASGVTRVVLHTNGNTFFNGGNLGVGTHAPNAKLEVLGVGGGTVDLKVNGRIETGDGGNNGGVWVSTANNLFFGQQNITSLGLYNNGAWRLIADNQGRVGIGTTSPTEKLTVDGKVRAEELIIEVVGAPDFVFEQSYDLKPLDEVKKYIDENKHLPEVPSAKEMEEDGVKVGEMEMILLKKIEELTLYLLQSRDEVKELRSENKMLKDRYEMLDGEVQQIKKSMNK